MIFYFRSVSEGSSEEEGGFGASCHLLHRPRTRFATLQHNRQQQQQQQQLPGDEYDPLSNIRNNIANLVCISTP